MKFFTLESPIRWIFLAHALIGTLALSVMLIPLLAKKGGKTHTRVGWLYTLSMIVVGLSAMAMTSWRALLDPNRTSSSLAFALFLFFIALFTLSSLNYGISALKHKTRKTSLKSTQLIGPPILVTAAGGLSVLVGIHVGNIFLIAFPAFGFLNSKMQLTYWLNPPKTKMHWWYAHMAGMFTACIATITAFLVTAIPRIWPNPVTNSPVLWIAPGLILGFFLERWTISYQTQFKDLESNPS
jgi:hypothetical protein